MTHRRSFRHLSRIFLIGIVCHGALGCGSSEVPTASIPAQAAKAENNVTADPGNQEPVTVSAQESASRSPARAGRESYPEVLIETNQGKIKLRLDSQKAPQTVDNFLANYVERKFYDDTIFHYVDAGFMIAAGGFDQQLQAKETRTPIINEADNGLSNRRGTVAMSRHPEYVHSATSQFFINLVDNPSLDNQETDPPSVNGYCVFGEVIEGMDIVDRIAQVDVEDRGDFPKTPVEPIVILKMTRVK